MKPSFAYVERITPRLDEVASTRRRCGCVSATCARLPSGGTASRRRQRRSADYERVEAVAFELAGPRLHDKGVVSPALGRRVRCLGKPYRAFVSALRAARRRRHHVDVASLQPAARGRRRRARAPVRGRRRAPTRGDVGGDRRPPTAEANAEWRAAVLAGRGVASDAAGAGAGDGDARQRVQKLPARRRRRLRRRLRAARAVQQPAATSRDPQGLPRAGVPPTTPTCSSTRARRSSKVNSSSSGLWPRTGSCAPRPEYLDSKV